MASNETNTEVSLFRLWKVLKRRKLWLLLPVVLLGPASAYYATWLPEIYTARVLMAAESAVPMQYVTGRDDSAAMTGGVQEHLRTIREILFNRSLLESVIQEFKLYDTGTNIEPAILDMKSRIETRVEGSDAFTIRFQGTDPQQVRDVANRLAELFATRTADVRTRRVTEAADFLDEEVKRLQEQVNAQEEAVRSYKQSIPYELPEHVDANLKQLENLQQQIQSKTDKITEDQARRSALLEETKQLERQGAPESRERQEKTEADTALEQARLKLAQLRARYTARHPEIARTEREIGDLEANRARRPAPIAPAPSPPSVRYNTLKAELESVNERLKNYQQDRKALVSQLSLYERRIGAAPRHEREVIRRMRELEVTRTRYEALLAKQQSAKLDQRLEKGHKGLMFRVVEPAGPPQAPVPTRRQRVVLLGLLGSLGAGILLVLLVEQMDTSFDTAEELQTFTNLPLLSVVPNIPGQRLFGRNGRRRSVHAPDPMTPSQRRQYEKNLVVMLSDRESVPSEQYGILAQKIRQWVQQNGSQTLLVTSAAGGEGKSITSVNLSLALSFLLDGGVVLVDSDLRRPRIHECLGLKPNKGFGDLVSNGDADIRNYVTDVHGLHVICGGPQSVNPATLLASRRAREVLKRLQDEYRLVVLDTPPLVPIVDSHILASTADGVLLVVRARRTRRELFRRAVESLGTSNVLGMVLNDTRYTDTRYAYAYQYYQRHYLGRR